MKTKGNWVIKTNAGGYWCGNAHFDSQLRKAQIYHWKEAAEDQIEVIKKRKYIPADLTFEVIAIAPPQELKDTEAEWLFHYDEECGIVHVSYTCSCCGHSALNDYRGRSTDSRFCPRCGKRMINSTIEED